MIYNIFFILRKEIYGNDIRAFCEELPEVVEEIGAEKLIKMVNELNFDDVKKSCAAMTGKKPEEMTFEIIDTCKTILIEHIKHRDSVLND